MRELLQRMRDKYMPSAESAMAGVRGLGIGATAGIIKYPAAAAMVLADQVMAENPQLSMSQALELVNEQQRADRETNPVAAYGGEVVGSLVPGAAGLKAIQKAGQLGKAGAAGAARRGANVAGVGAVQGGVTGFNENQDLGDAAIGALAGGSLAALGQPLQAGMDKVVREAAKKVARQSEQQSRQLVLQQAAELEAFRQLPRNAQTQQQVTRLKQQIAGNTDSANKTAKAIQRLDDPSLTAAQALGKDGKKILNNMFNNTVGNRSQALSTLGNPLVGAGFGAGGAYLTGNDPVAGAMLGGAGGMLLTGKAGMLGKLPRGMVPAAGAMAGSQVPRFSTMGAPTTSPSLADAEDEFSKLLMPLEDEEEDFEKLFIKE